MKRKQKIKRKNNVNNQAGKSEANYRSEKQKAIPPKKPPKIRQRRSEANYQTEKQKAIPPEKAA
ncbi:MAG: hypothetical protein II685_06530 [Clostridia bacterium]|nr:hypothetical protein [Clostridia bacterium]